MRKHEAHTLRYLAQSTEPEHHEREEATGILSVGLHLGLEAGRRRDSEGGRGEREAVGEEVCVTWSM